MSEINLNEIESKLMEPFQPNELKWLPAMVKGNRAMALVYVDARVIQDRLDSVLGVLGWQDSYQQLENGSVICTLRLKLGTEWISKMDVGSPSEQPSEGDRLKAAFSDALKRAAVKFGVGRYLYRFPRNWVDYDPQKKQIVQPPPLPHWAIPEKQAKKNNQSTSGSDNLIPPQGGSVNTQRPQQPKQKLEAPYVSDADPSELIPLDCQHYLEQLLDEKGFTVKAIFQRFPVQSLGDLTFGNYQQIVTGLSSRPNKRNVSNAAG